jgi:hypothetical protein
MMTIPFAPDANFKTEPYCRALMDRDASPQSRSS